ncbi:MAG: hypothetical protein ACON3Z_09695 [Bradymonadia bacterium]
MYIVDEDQLQQCADALLTSDLFFIDTEFESRRSGTELCLLQISDGERAYLVDAIELDDLRPLAAALGREDVCWVVHAGRQDVGLLMDALDLEERPRIFDTQVAWSMLSAEYQVSLSYVKMRVIGSRQDKGSQTSNWKRRPLTEDQLTYALGDVECLPKIHEYLSKSLTDLRRLDACFHASAETFEKRVVTRDDVTLSSYRNLWQLTAKQQAGLRVLLEWHNRFGGQRGSPHWKTLFNIAAAEPKDVDALSDIKGVSRSWSRTDGAKLITQMAEAMSCIDDSVEVPTSQPSPYATFDQHYREAWLVGARADICATEHIAPELAFPGWLMKRLRAVVHDVNNPTLLADEFTGWRSLLKPAWERFCRETSEHD